VDLGAAVLGAASPAGLGRRRRALGREGEGEEEVAGRCTGGPLADLGVAAPLARSSASIGIAGRSDARTSSLRHLRGRRLHAAGDRAVYGSAELLRSTDPPSAAASELSPPSPAHRLHPRRQLLSRRAFSPLPLHGRRYRSLPLTALMRLPQPPH